MSLAGCCFCPSFVPLRPGRVLVWVFFMSLFLGCLGVFCLPSVLAPPLLCDGQRHAPPFKIGFGWGFLLPLFGGRFAPVPRGASPPPFMESDKLSLYLDR